MKKLVRSYCSLRIILLSAVLSALAGAARSAPSQGYPCWRGPNGSGAVDSGVELVDSLADAKELWSTDVELPGCYAAAIHTGNSGVTAGNGRVLVVYHDPNDEVWDEAWAQETIAGKGNKAYEGHWKYSTLAREAGKSAEARAAFAHKRSSIAADDVILCADAATGKALWRTVVRRRGLNTNRQGRGWNISPKCGPHIIPCEAYGKVFAFGNTGRFYGLDAATGKPLWETDLGGIHEELDAKLIKYRALKYSPGYGRSELTTGPTYAGGVIVAYNDGGALVGFDPETGKRLWTTPGRLGGYTGAPIRWVHKGKEYVIASGLCVDPEDGRKLWEADASAADTVACVSGDYLVLGRTCFRITPEKVEKLWTFPTRKEDAWKYCTMDKGLSFRNGSPVIVNGYVIWKSFSYGQGAQGSSVLLVELATGKMAARVEHGGEIKDAFGQGNSSFVGGDGRAFLELNRDSASKVAMFHMDPATVLPKYSTLAVPDYAMSTTPVYTGGRLFLRTHNALKCFDLRKAPAALPTLSRERLGTVAGLSAKTQGLLSASLAAREDAVEELSASPDSASAAAQVLAEGLWPAQRAAADVLIRLGLTAKEAAPQVEAVFARNMETPDGATLALLTRCLLAIDPPRGQAAVKRLGDLVAGSDAGKVRHAVSALRDLGPGGAAALPQLAALSKQSEADLQELVLDTIGWVGVGSEVPVPSLSDIIAAEDVNARVRACLALARIGPAGKKAGLVLLQALQKTGRDRRQIRAICLAIGAVGVDDGGPATKLALMGGDRQVTEWTTFAVRGLGPKAVKPLVTALEKNDRGATYYRESLQAMDRSVLPELEAAAKEIDITGPPELKEFLDKLIARHRK